LYIVKASFIEALLFLNGGFALVLKKVGGFLVILWVMSISSVSAAETAVETTELIAAAIDEHTAVIAMSEMARLVIDTVDGKFHFITYIVSIGMALLAALITFFGFNQYWKIRDIATTEASKVTAPIKAEYDKLMADIEVAKGDHAAIIASLAKVEAGIQTRANNLINLQIANICLSDPNLSDRNKRQGTEFLRRIIEETEHTEANNYILSTAYTMYSYILKRQDGKGAKAACKILETAVSKGIRGYGIFYNLACYCDKSDLDVVRGYLDKASEFDKTTIYNAMEDPDLKDYVAKIYNLETPDRTV